MPQPKPRASGALHTLVQQFSLTTESGVTFGTLIAEVEIVETNDLRNLYGNKCYAVTCRQRVTVPGCGWPIHPKSPLTSTFAYPAILTHTLTPAFPAQAKTRLLDYSPKTVNTAVVTSNNVSNGSNSSAMQQYSSGSSNSQTNSYDVSVSAGFMDDVITGGISAGYSYASTTEDNSSRSSGSSSGVDAQAGAGASMTMKDWGGYASLDATRSVPTWSWMQEYPWNVGDYNAVQSGKIFVPPAVQALLAYLPVAGSKETAFVFPPSELATYGVDFVSVARWQVEVPADAATSTDEVIAFTHRVDCYLGQHGVHTSKKSTTPEVWVALNGPSSGTVDVNTLKGQPISMSLLGLSAITTFEPGNGALVGFVPGQMLYGPDATQGAFRVMSEANNLYVTGTGFVAFDNDHPNAVMTSNPAMSATTPALVDAYFKIVDKSEDISLYLKHWRTGPQGVLLHISINGAPPIVRHVDAKEASDGSANLSVIQLCNRDLNSAEYFDYLRLGLNHIVLSIQPSTDYAEGTCGYALRALAIG